MAFTTIRAMPVSVRIQPILICSFRGGLPHRSLILRGLPLNPRAFQTVTVPRICASGLGVL